MQTGSLIVSATLQAVHKRAANYGHMMHSVHMRRTNVLVDAQLLSEVTRVLGVKTYSAAVNTALAEVIRIRRVLSLPSFFGRGLWQGDLRKVRVNRQSSSTAGRRKKRGSS
jgi:Arc/MetJ family transcription regulator